LAVLVAVGLLGIFGLVRDVRTRTGVIRNASCVWHGRDLVMSAVVANNSMSGQSFVLRARFALNGRAVAVPGDWAVPVDARGTTTWRWVDRYEADRAGTPITGCTPSVTLPSSDD
jgi:hypothetical protein